MSFGIHRNRAAPVSGDEARLTGNGVRNAQRRGPSRPGEAGYFTARANARRPVTKRVR